MSHDFEVSEARSVYVTQCTRLTTEKNPGSLLQEGFQQFGEIVGARLFGPPGGPYKGCGVVTFVSVESAVAALNAGFTVCGAVKVMIKPFDRSKPASTNKSSHRESNDRRSETRHSPRDSDGPFGIYERRKHAEKIARLRDEHKEDKAPSSKRRRSPTPEEKKPQHSFRLAPLPPPVQSPPNLIDESSEVWMYTDPKGATHGPYTLSKLRKWFERDQLPASLIINNISNNLSMPVQLALSVNTVPAQQQEPWKNVFQVVRDIAMKALELCAEVNRTLKEDTADAVARLVIDQLASTNKHMMFASIQEASAGISPSLRASIGATTLQHIASLI
jgi:hypothetical protein